MIKQFFFHHVKKETSYLAEIEKRAENVNILCIASILIVVVVCPLK